MTVFLAFLVLVLTFGVASAGINTLAPDESLLQLIRPVIDAVMSGHYFIASAAALVFVAAVANRYGGKHVAFLNTDYGRALTVLVGAFGGSLLSAAYTGASFTVAIGWSAVKVAFFAAGGYSLAKPLVRFLPSWLQPYVMWIFNKPDPVAGVVAAGDAAVKANPAPGVTGVTGKVRDVE
jgi:hypothetical protein